MSKTKKIVIYSCISAFLLLLLILGTIYDLQISKALASLNNDSYLSHNFFAVIGETFGENILYVLLVSALAIIFFNFQKRKLINKNWLNNVLMFFCFVAAYIVCFYCINKTLSYISEHSAFGLDNFLSSSLGLIIVLSFSLIVNIFAFLLFNKLSETSLAQLFWWAILVLMVAAVSNTIIQTTKHVFDRTRYRAMHFVGDENFSYYTPWYKVNNNKFNSISIFADDFFKSFPSGHTCAAANSATLIALPIFIKKFNNKKWKTIFTASSVAYTLFVALSRIVAGAHFFTDTLIATLITFVCVFVCIIIVKKIKCRVHKESANN
ncbi:MAG: phosphatase PAP2 family protein [Clostridia bacterium]|nr:phosphatase PAP2 family protein [Clostridia bacterium]